MVTWKASVFTELQLVEQWAIHVRISSLMEEHIIGRVFKCGLKQDRKIDSKEADGMDTSLLNTTSNCEAFPSETFCRPQAVILFSYLCAHLTWLWGKTDESSQSTSYKLNYFVYHSCQKYHILLWIVFVLRSPPMKLVWNRTDFPKRKLTESNACTWAPVHDVAMPTELCWFLQLHNLSKFAAPHVTISVIELL